MAVKINLETEGTPGGKANIAQAQLFVDEIKVVVQALAVVGPQVGLPSFLVVPRLVGGTRFHGREDAHQAGVVPPLRKNFLDPIFFAEILFTNEHDFQAVLGGESFGILSQGVAQRLSKAGIIKNPGSAEPSGRRSCPRHNRAPARFLGSRGGRSRKARPRFRRHVAQSTVPWSFILLLRQASPSRFPSPDQILARKR